MKIMMSVLWISLQNMVWAFDSRNHHLINIGSNEPFFIATSQFPSDCLGKVISFLCNEGEFARFRLVSRQFHDVSLDFFLRIFRPLRILCGDLLVTLPLVPRMYVPLRTKTEINSTLMHLHREHLRFKRSVFCGLCIESGLTFMSLHLRDIGLSRRLTVHDESDSESVLICMFGHEAMWTAFMYNEGMSLYVVDDAFDITKLRELLRGGSVDYQRLFTHPRRSKPTPMKDPSVVLCIIGVGGSCLIIGFMSTLFYLLFTH